MEGATAPSTKTNKMKAFIKTIIVTVITGLTIPTFIVFIWLVSVGGFDLLATLRNEFTIIINAIITAVVFVAYGLTIAEE